MRSGPSAGTRVPLASILVTDQSEAEKKVVLWRRAAFWVLTVSPGDVLQLTGTQIHTNTQKHYNTQTHRSVSVVYGPTMNVGLFIGTQLSED